MPTINTNLETVSYNGHALPVADMSAKTVAYLLQYGFAQSLQDAVAGSAKAIKDLAAECRKGGDGFDKAFAKWEKAYDYAELLTADFMSDADVDLVAKRTVSRDQAERFDAILAGTVGTRSTGPRGDVVSRVMAEIAEKVIRQVHATKGMKLPDAAGMKAYIAQYLDKYADKTRAEAEAQIARDKAMAESVDITL